MAKQDLVKNDDSIPTSTQVEAANSTTVYDSQNNPIKVSSFLSDQSNKTKILIMVRHFYCGMCAAYLMAILDDPRLSHLMKSPDGDDQAEIIVVGPGNAANIEKYREFAGGIKCKVYTDPTKSLYKALNVTKRTLDLGSNPPQHLKDGFWNITLRSTKEMITAGPLRMFGGGDKKQLGAEFIFDSQGQCSFSHRMSNTRDHTEVSDLANYAGYGEPEKKIEVPVGVQNLQNGKVKAESQAVAAA